MKFVILSLLLGLAWPAQAGEWKSRQVGRMETLVYHPTDKPGTRERRSLMISLHGCDQSPETLQKHGNWEAAADEGGMLVALPRVPEGGVIMGCWDYYGADHKVTNRHNKDLIDLAETLVADKELRIDPSRVYVSGLSSGGGEAMVLACLRPDLFSGVGLSSAPGIGTGIADLHQARLDVNEAVRLCTELAGDHKAGFATQSAAIITGDNDYLVNPGHSELNRDVFRKLYGADREIQVDPKSLPGTRTAGEAHMYFPGAQGPGGYRVAHIVNSGLGHAWPAGQGGSATQFVAKDSVNFPLFLVRYFAQNHTQGGSQTRVRR